MIDDMYELHDLINGLTPKKKVIDFIKRELKGDIYNYPSILKSVRRECFSHKDKKEEALHVLANPELYPLTLGSIATHGFKG